jgi:hypothetical protein
MNQHLALIKTSQAEQKSIDYLSDMDIIFAQAQLMDAGSISFKAIKAGEIADILAGLVALSYAALEALSMLDSDVVESVNESRPTYQMLAIMQLLSDKINVCSSGKAEHYSALYHVCSHLATDFLKADFDKAFKVYHEWRKLHQLDKAAHLKNCPDMTDCLYE